MTVESVQPEEPRVRELPDPPLAGGGVPGLGHAGKLVRDPLALLSRMRDHGDVVRLRLGPRTLYAVTAPELTGSLVTRPEYEIGGPLWDTLEVLLGKGVANTNGASHRRQRQTIQPSFRNDRIHEYETVMVEEARDLAERLTPGQTVDVTREAFRTGVRVTARCFHQVENIDELAERLSTALATVFGGMYRRMILSFGPLYRLPFPANRQFDRALAELHRLADEIIAERRAATDRPDDLLTALLEATDENGEPVSHQEVHDQVIAILTPGSETVGAQLMWILQLLADHPEHADRMSKEVESVVGDRNVTFGDLEKLTHTRNVITEALRIRPAVWILTRRSVAETELGGYRIPAGADIVYSPLAIQRDPRTYERHLEFDPDRWEPERAQDIPKYAMVPFGAGNRKCPGNHFSLAELAVILATLIPKWRFEHVPQSDTSMRFGITLRPKRLLLKAVPR
ncbi:cytochrome P450 [Streptomyces phyllanthi]|uniref:Cytochrome P450 n=1 Tax=Streptomyces phyllanthi TaxID=1803180 RepID=A0A5N8VYL6_9ACTN|nr:cytochrome P450 [Streptomyces phyllanthi]MPY39912.1 cytochrome P450 [Streptomyces phyllanthi]